MADWTRLHRFARSNPIFDPERDMAPGQFVRMPWPSDDITVGLTVNVGME
jgi:hypothetical protein